MQIRGYPIRTGNATKIEVGDIITEWRARPHPFGGGYCVVRSVNGKSDHLLSRIGCAPTISSFYSRVEAQVQADSLNQAIARPA